MKIERARSEEVETLGELIRDVRVAMLTTVSPEGALVSRPLHTLEVEFDGDLWFVTAADSGKLVDIAHDNHVNVAYSAPERDTYVSVVGHARVVRDRERIERLWTEDMNTYFPQGKDDPNIALLTVEVDSAEYWTGTGELVSSFLEIASHITGRGVVHTGENRVIDLPHQH